MSPFYAEKSDENREVVGWMLVKTYFTDIEMPQIHSVSLLARCIVSLASRKQKHTTWITEMPVQMKKNFKVKWSCGRIGTITPLSLNTEQHFLLRRISQTENDGLSNMSLQKKMCWKILFFESFEKKLWQFLCKSTVWMWRFWQTASPMSSWLSNHHDRHLIDPAPEAHGNVTNIFEHSQH